MSVPRQALRLIKRAGAYIVYFVALNGVLAGYMLTEVSWIFLHPANFTSLGDWPSATDIYLRNWLGLPPRDKKAKKQEPDEAIDGGEPDYLWSENASWILSVFEPWGSGDGYSEEVVSAAEAIIGTRLPERLRSFYRSWGRRQEMIGYRDYLILPDARLVFPDAVVIALENQGTIYWSILRESLMEPDPPVYFAEINWRDGADTPNVGVWRFSHEHVSDFLDGFVLAHAFAKGAVHGAEAHTSTNEIHRLRQQIDRSEQWIEVVIESVPWTLWTIMPEALERRWPVFVGDGAVIDCSSGVLVAASSDEQIDQVADLLQTSWQDRW